MFKFLLFILAIALSVNAAPYPREDFSDFPDVNYSDDRSIKDDFPDDDFPKMEPIKPLNDDFPPMDEPSADEIEHLKKGGENSHVHGHYTSSQHTVETINGKVVKDSGGGEDIDNNDGNVHKMYLK